MRKLFLTVVVLSATLFAHAADTNAQDGDSIRSYQMNEVVVSASRSGTMLKDIPQKVEIISNDMLKSLPNDNLAEVLKRATNLDIIEYPGLLSQIGMRGFSPSAHSRSYVLVLINGVAAGTTNLSEITVDNIERIEVIKGPYSVLYGSDAMGGVINIITKKSIAQSQGNVSVESGSFGYTKLSGNFTGVGSDKFTYGLGYNHQQQSKDYRIGDHNFLHMSDVDKMILDKASYGDVMQNSQYELNAINGFANYAFNQQWKARLDGMYTFADDVESPGTYWGVYGQTKKDIRLLNLNLSLEQNGEKNHFRFAPYFNNDKDPNYSDNTDAAFVNFTSTTKEYGYQLQDGYQFGNLNLLAGHDLHVYDYASQNFSAKDVETAPYKPNNRFINLALFAQATYAWEGLHVNAGLRYDHFDYQIDANADLNSPKASANYNTVNPSVGAQYVFLKDFKAHASYGSAFSVPDAYQVAGQYTMSYTYGGVTYATDYVGNANLKPEKSRTADVGIAYDSRRTGLKIDLTYFHTNFNDRMITQYSSDLTAYTYVNANKSLMDGLELVSSFNFGQFIRPTLDIEAYANFTWMFTNNVTTAAGVTQDALYVRKTNGNFGLSYQDRKISMRLNGRLIGSRLETDNFSYIRTGITAADYYTKGGYTAADGVLQIPSFLVFDYSIGYAFSPKVNFGITVANLLDENYTEKDGYNMPGRSIIAKVSYKF